MIYVDIEKNFGKFNLRTKFEFDNEIMGLLGASGSGKSLTLKCIAGIEKPDKGRIVLNDRVLFDSEKKINISPKDRKIGYLFQDYALFPNMNVYENIKVGIREGENFDTPHIDGKTKAIPPHGRDEARAGGQHRQGRGDGSAGAVGAGRDQKAGTHQGAGAA